MLEMKIKIEAPDLSAALDKLAESLGKSTFVAMHGTDNKVIGYTPEVNVTTDKAPVIGHPAPVAPVPAPAVAAPASLVTPAPVAPADPTPAPAPAPVAPAVSAPASTVPTSTTAAPTAAPAPVQAAVAQTAPAAAVPVAPAPTYTLDQISKAGAALVDMGKMEQLLALLSKYGVAAVTQLAPDQYGIFATELRALGAQI
jgi:hypothetical protein